jgi:hypothetical protein
MDLDLDYKPCENSHDKSLHARLVQALIEASSALVSRIHEFPDVQFCTLAVVFDIDGTLIDETGEVISPVVQLYNFCRLLRLNTFIVTARTEDGREETLQELARHQIEGYVDCYFRKTHEYDVAMQKRAARKHIHERGYAVIMSVGDMDWDVGEYGGIPLVLPRNYINAPLSEPSRTLPDLFSRLWEFLSLSFGE